MTEKESLRSIDNASVASIDVLAINNKIIGLRPTIKRIKIQVIAKMCRQIKKLKMKKATENEKVKNISKAERLLEEINIIKTLKEDKVSKFAFAKIPNSKKTSEKSGPVELRALSRLSEHKLLKKAIEDIRNCHSDWRDLAAFLLVKQSGRRFKTKKQKEVKQKEHNIANIEVSKELTSSYLQQRFDKKGVFRANEKTNKSNRPINVKQKSNTPTNFKETDEVEQTKPQNETNTTPETCPSNEDISSKKNINSNNSNITREVDSLVKVRKVKEKEIINNDKDIKSNVDKKKSLKSTSKIKNLEKAKAATPKKENKSDVLTKNTNCVVKEIFLDGSEPGHSNEIFDDEESQPDNIVKKGSFKLKAKKSALETTENSEFVTPSVFVPETSGEYSLSFECDAFLMDTEEDSGWPEPRVLDNNAARRQDRINLSENSTIKANSVFFDSLYNQNIHNINESEERNERFHSRKKSQPFHKEARRPNNFEKKDKINSFAITSNNRNSQHTRGGESGESKLSSFAAVKLHPSWEASKRKKAEQAALTAFSGTKIVFEDD